MWRPIRQFPLLKTYRSFPQPPFFPPPSLSHPQDTPSQVSSEGQRGPWRAKGAQNTEAVSKDKCRAERQEGFSARGLLGMNGQGNTTQFLAPQTLKEPPWLAWLFLLLSPSHAHRTHLSPEEQRMPWRAQPGGRRGPQRSEKPQGWRTRLGTSGGSPGPSVKGTSGASPNELSDPRGSLPFPMEQVHLSWVKPLPLPQQPLNSAGPPALVFPTPSYMVPGCPQDSSHQPGHGKSPMSVWRLS